MSLNTSAPWSDLEETEEDFSSSEMSLSHLEAVARNCSLRLEHFEALNSSDTELISRLYNMCEHTWDPAKTWRVYYWNELIPPLVVYT